MKKKTVFELGVIGIASVALLFASMSLVRQAPWEKAGKPPMASGVPASVPSEGDAIKVIPMKDDTFYVRLNKVADALPLQRDPFTFSGIGTSGPRDGLELTGILWDQGKPVAVIEGQFLSVGDAIDQCKVISISESSVVLQDPRGQFELRLKQG